MNLFLTGIVAGVLGTLAMDLLNNLVARTGVFLKINVAMIGQMVAGWTRGRFRYEHPDEMEQVPHQMVYGYLAHFAIGVGLAVPFVYWVGIFGSEGLCRRYGLSYIVLRRQRPPSFSYTLQWASERLAEGHLKESRPSSLLSRTTFSMEWVLQSESC
jgi:uncharacterized membrane protein YeaQ/YmgE (transglycosylase-associated protein family)